MKNVFEMLHFSPISANAHDSRVTVVSGELE